MHHHVRAPPETFTISPQGFNHVHVDLVGPHPPFQGYTYLLTIVDGFTRSPEAIPLASINTESCARVFARHWIARFGVPGDMSSDRGTQFMSDLWMSLSNLLGIQVHRTTAYHPQANGLVERFHQSL